MVLTKISILVALASGASEGIPGAEVPSALRAFQEARKGIVSGRVEWVVYPKDDAEAWLLFVSRFGKNGDMLFEHRGDKNGWTLFQPQTKRGKSKYPSMYLRNADGYWRMSWPGETCTWWRETPDPSYWCDNTKDIRSVGVFVSSNTVKFGVGFKALFDNPYYRVRSWEQVRAGELYRVTAACESGATVTWEINPNKGWNAERVFVRSKDRTREARCALKKYGNAWLPEKTEFFTNGELVETIEIRSASLNQPDDPLRLTPADAGLQAGANIAGQDGPPAEVGKPLVWNGDEVSSWDQWEADVHDGKRQPGPIMLKRMRGEEIDDPYRLDRDRAERTMAQKRMAQRRQVAQHERLWLKYVRDFIARYKLNEEQSARAMKILADCQQRARKIVDRTGPQLTSLLAQIEDATRENQPEKLQRLRARVDELRAPIRTIFETQLKPRLEKLPTRAQRQAAEKPPKQP